MDDSDLKRARKECWECENAEPVPGDCHIKCADPDTEMTGNPHGIKSGWFIYPSLFDPVWKTKLCSNFKKSGRGGVDNKG